MEQPTAIDGDIVAFIQSMAPETVYSTDELVSYLRDQGHREPDILHALRHWQGFYFTPSRKSWERFLSGAGTALLQRLRNRTA
jgi:hypothetical protein